jgi:hypothetical protein
MWSMVRSLPWSALALTVLFQYAGRASSELLRVADRRGCKTRRQPDSHTITFTEPESGLACAVAVSTTTFHGEWTVYSRTQGRRTPDPEDLQGLDVALVRG